MTKHIYQFAPPQHPLALILCGAPGVGKSTLRDSVLMQKGVHPNYAIMADPDLVFSYMSPEQKENLNCQKVSTDILLERFMDKFIQSRHHIVYDTTCRVVKNTINVINKLKRAGYYVLIVSVYASPEISIARVGNTGTRNRRVPNNIIIKTHQELSQKLPTYHGMGDELMLFNNDRGPVLLYHRVGAPHTGQVFENRPFYYNYRADRAKRGGRRTRKKVN